VLHLGYSGLAPHRATKRTAGAWRTYSDRTRRPPVDEEGGRDAPRETPEGRGMGFSIRRRRLASWPGLRFLRRSAMLAAIVALAAGVLLLLLGLGRLLAEWGGLNLLLRPGAVAVASGLGLAYWFLG